MENTFDLVPVIDNATGKYVVKDYEKAKAIVKNFIDESLSKVIEINDDAALKEVKATRTEIRKKNEIISKARKDISALLLGEFSRELKELETMLKTADATLKDKVNAYNDKIGKSNEKPKVITLVIKGYDMKTIEKVKGFALKQNPPLGVEII